LAQAKKQKKSIDRTDEKRKSRETGKKPFLSGSMTEKDNSWK
jgi:hypothetical protein